MLQKAVSRHSEGVMKLEEMIDAGLIQRPSKEQLNLWMEQLTAEADRLEAEEFAERLRNKEDRVALDRSRRKQNKTRKGRK